MTVPLDSACDVLASRVFFIAKGARMASPLNLTNQTAIVTGASSGISKGIAIGLAAALARVVVNDVGDIVSRLHGEWLRWLSC